MTHPYQSQSRPLWELSKKQNRALKDGYYLESVSLGYNVLEISLRFLLTSKKGRGPISSYIIDRQRYLMDLAQLALDNDMIDVALFDKIAKFNADRRDSTHGLAQGRIAYNDLKEAAESIGRLWFDIQNQWLTATCGEPVSVNT